jgi:hypothetical protein
MLPDGAVYQQITSVFDHEHRPPRRRRYRPATLIQAKAQNGGRLTYRPLKA